MRRRDWIPLAGFLAALLVVVFLGRRAAPDASWQDPRASTYRTGPDGVAALAEVLEGLGVAVERRRIPLFGIAEDLARPGPRRALVVLNPWFAITPEERREVGRYVAGGGTVVLAGWTGIEEELGLVVRSVGDISSDADTSWVSPPPGIGSVPAVGSVLGRHRPASGDPPLPLVTRVDTLLLARNRRPVAARLHLSGGGRALIVAESDWVRNRGLRETDVGALVVPWLLALGAERLVVDEYHHGFGRSGAVLGASWRWLRSGPPGWAMLQLTLAGLLTLATLAFRFGPALSVIQRRRRSPLEHLEALAAGLERARGRGVVSALLGRGLARRLRGAGHVVPRATWSRDREPWLAALARGSHDPAARAAVSRLGGLLREGGDGDDHVLRTAQAVEDVWEALKRPSGPAPS